MTIILIGWLLTGGYLREKFMPFLRSNLNCKIEQNIVRLQSLGKSKFERHLKDYRYSQFYYFEEVVLTCLVFPFFE